MKPNIHLLQSVWKKSEEFISKTNIDIDKKTLDEIIASIFCPGPFYFFIIDFADLTLKYISPHITALHGLDPATATFDDILHLMHPDDMNFVSNAEKKVVSTLYNDLGIDKVTKYKMSYCFRCKVADGTYQLFNHQALVLTLDESGRTSQSLNVHTNISHLTTVNNYKLSLIGIMGEPSFSNIDVFEEAPLGAHIKPLFSKREKEIIRLLADGCTTALIADKLFIAHSTVKNHRKNILAKATCTNTGQLISKCMMEGLV